jgi:hypothetical protein
VAPQTETPLPSLSLLGLKSHRYQLFLPCVFSFSTKACNRVLSSPIDPLSDAADQSTTDDDKFRAAAAVFSPSQ